MRLIWLVMMGCAACTMNNPAFMASAGDDGSSGDGGSASDSASAGSTTRPIESTGEPPSTTATPTSTTTITTDPEPATGTDPASSGQVSTDPGETTSETTGVDPNETTGSTGAPDPVCGNGVVEDGEVCDQGQNEPAPEKCSPDCQAVIEKKRIFAFNAGLKGFFMNLEIADAKCQDAAALFQLDGEYKALISDGDLRVGSVMPNDGLATEDWPLHPYTAYFNRDSKLVWITLERRLLGVGLNNNPVALPNAIEPESLNYAVWTGLQTDWISGPNCGKWTGNGGINAIAGKAYKLEGYLDAAGHQPCEQPWGLICVQQ